MLFVLAALASAENCARNTAVEAFTVFFKASSAFAFTAFAYLLRLIHYLEALLLVWLAVLRLLLLLVEGVGVPGKGLYNGLSMLFLVISVVSAILTIALWHAQHSSLEALAVQLQTARLLTVAASSGLLSLGRLLFVHAGNYDVMGPL